MAVAVGRGRLEPWPAVAVAVGRGRLEPLPAVAVAVGCDFFFVGWTGMVETRNSGFSEKKITNLAPVRCRCNEMKYPRGF